MEWQLQSETKLVILVSVGFRNFMFEWFPSINSDCAPFEEHHCALRTGRCRQDSLDTMSYRHNCTKFKQAKGLFYCQGDTLAQKSKSGM